MARRWWLQLAGQYQSDERSRLQSVLTAATKAERQAQAARAAADGQRRGPGVAAANEQRLRKRELQGAWLDRRVDQRAVPWPRARSVPGSRSEKSAGRGADACHHQQ